LRAIIGLWNEGYDLTRHNLGAMFVDELAKSFNLSFSKNSKLLSYISKKDEYLLAKPLVYMNQSGASISKVVNFFKIELNQLTVVHDDMDLPLGSYRIKLGGGSAGHNGIKSIDQNLGNQNYWRIRIGIGKPEFQGQVTDYVLGKISENELKIIKQVFHDLIDQQKLSRIEALL
jgi:PTH1 family peptidyl-tRNA hydrolase